MSQPRPETRGAELLRDAISPRYTQEQIAAHLKVRQQTVSSWVQGRTKPSAEAMAALEDMLGIPMRAWAEALPDDAEEEPPAKNGTEH